MPGAEKNSFKTEKNLDEKKQVLKSHTIQIALVTAGSIILLAWVSKRLLPEPIGYLSLAIPPLIATISETLLGKYKETCDLKTSWFIFAILLSTAVIIFIHLTA